jgi:DNA repair protein RadA/Sms
MPKPKTIYICQECGAESPKWLGRCGACSAWNSMVEETRVKKPSQNINTGSKIDPVPFSELSSLEEKRTPTRIVELDRILGGGLVPGSVVLVGGEPGIGKSTLALQIAMIQQNGKCFYVSGEESPAQVKLRANRIGTANTNCFILPETNLENIIYQIEKNTPSLVIIDSIQTLQSDLFDSSPGTITQIRECTQLLLKMAKQNSIPVLLIGHINKEGNLAGPKVLEHIVDTVLQFEGDQNNFYRILRSLKNRFGSTSEIGIFEMTSSGLKEITNPSEILLTRNDDNLSGISISATMDGIRPFLIEVQSLVSTAAYGTPQRSSTGFDTRRLNMILAVLEKRAGFRLSQKDVFLNIAGGIKVNDPAIDMAVATAILSSNFDININPRYCFSGEIGLSGEIRPVPRIDKRIAEAQKLGFEKIFISKHNKKSIEHINYKIKIECLGRLEEMVKRLFK